MVSILAAVAVVIFGGHRLEFCDEAQGLNAVIGTSFDEVDIGDRKGCEVPRNRTWMVAAALAVVPSLVWAVTAPLRPDKSIAAQLRRPPSTRDDDGDGDGDTALEPGS